METELKEVLNVSGMLDKETIIKFYVQVNGVIELVKLISLLKDTGIKMTQKELLKDLKENNYRVEDKIIYLNDLLYENPQRNDLLLAKSNYDYKVFNDIEIMGYLSCFDRYLDEIVNLIFTKSKQTEENKKICEFVLMLISTGEYYEDLVLEYLSLENVKLTVKRKGKLLEEMEFINYNIPNMEINGYTPQELDVEVTEGDLDFSNWVDFDMVSDEEKILCYIDLYLTLNGVLDVSDLIKILREEHGFKITKSKLIDLINNEINDYEIIDNYVCLNYMEQEEIEFIMDNKQKVNKYKIVKDLTQTLMELEEELNALEDIEDRYNLKEEIIDAVKLVVQLGLIGEADILRELLSKQKFTKKEKEALKGELIELQKNMHCWILNGFKPLELKSEILSEEFV